MPKSQRKTRKDISPEPDAPMNGLAAPVVASSTAENWQISWPGTPGTQDKQVHGVLTIAASGAFLVTDGKGTLLAVQFGSGAVARRIDPKPLAPEPESG